MASTSKCPYCGNTVLSSEKNCQSCGAANELYVEDTPRIVDVPTTIEELQEYCAERGMPLLRMRFFIGEDFSEPKAFGIYRKPDGKVVVYKNKADGTRAIRYEGPNEKKGVAELWRKLLEECHNRGIYPENYPGDQSITPGYLKNTKKEAKESAKFIGKIILFQVFFLLSIACAEIFVVLPGTANTIADLCIAAVIDIIIIGIVYLILKKNKFIKQVIIFLIVVLLVSSTFGYAHTKHPEGYYRLNNTWYYRIGNSWYQYNSGSWSSCRNDYTDYLYDNETEYYEDDSWDDSWDATDFKNSSAYDTYRETHSSSSSSSNSSYSSWDSSSTDWDSDW